MANDAEEVPPAGDRLTSVDNALWLLQLVGEGQALRVSEAADILGVARSTAHRLLSALRRRDFLMQDKPNGVYRPGPALHSRRCKAHCRRGAEGAVRSTLASSRRRLRRAGATSCLPSAKCSTILAQKAGRSPGLQLDTRPCAKSPKTARRG